MFRYAFEVLNGLCAPNPLINQFIFAVNYYYSQQITLNQPSVCFATYEPIEIKVKTDLVAKVILGYAVKFTTRYIQNMVKTGFENIALVGGV